MVIGLLILVLGITWFTLPERHQGPMQAFPATINRDCAPWDGAAFTVQIPLNTKDTLDISIWKSPDIKSTATFSFPDQTGQAGNAVLIHPAGFPETLNGSVTFTRVEQENPAEGEFDLMTESGRQFKGKFKAQWEDQIAMCG